MAVANAAEQGRYALETRAEALALVSADAAVRRGDSDLFEIGRLDSSDVVDGGEETRTGGDHSEEAHSLLVRAARVDTQVQGKLSLKAHSDTTLLGGAMAETHLGPALLLAGMSDSLVAGGGMRVSVADLTVAGLVGLEEKIGSAVADGAMIEAYATHFEREYGAGNHMAGIAAFTGTVHTTMATGFRQLFKVANGVRNITPGGGSGAGPEGPAGSTPPGERPPAPLPPDAAGNGGLIGDTPEVSGVYDEINPYSQIGSSSDVAEPIYEDLPGAARAGDDSGADYANPNRLRSTNAAAAAGGPDALRENVDRLRDALTELFRQWDTNRSADTAETLGDLRSSADTAETLGDLRGAARDYSDPYSSALLDLVTEPDRALLPDEVTRQTLAEHLDLAQTDAIRSARGADADAQDAVNQAVEIYELARRAVAGGEDPTQILDQLAAIYRWRAENGVEAYRNQAANVANATSYVRDLLRNNGYQAAAAGTDQALDANTLTRLQDLFGVGEAAGASDELAEVEGAARLGDLVGDLDGSAAGSRGADAAEISDPRTLTAQELDGYQADGKTNWVEGLRSDGDAPDAPAGAVPSPEPNPSLQQLDDRIFELLDNQARPPLQLEDDARLRLAAQLESQQAAATALLDQAPKGPQADRYADQIAAYGLAAQAIQEGEDPLPALNDLVEVYRWRQGAGAETYAGQTRVIEGVRDEVAQLFRSNDVASLNQASDSRLLVEVQELAEVQKLAPNLPNFLLDTRVLDASDGRAAIAQAEELAGAVPPQLPVDLVDDGASSRFRWQGREVGAEGLADVSTDPAVRVSALDGSDATQNPYERVQTALDDSYDRLNYGGNARTSNEPLYSSIENPYSALNRGDAPPPRLGDRQPRGSISDNPLYASSDFLATPPDGSLENPLYVASDFSGHGAGRFTREPDLRLAGFSRHPTARRGRPPRGGQGKRPAALSDPRRALQPVRAAGAAGRHGRRPVVRADPRPARRAARSSHAHPADGRFGGGHSRAPPDRSLRAGAGGGATRRRPGGAAREPLAVGRASRRARHGTDRRRSGKSAEGPRHSCRTPRHGHRLQRPDGLRASGRNAASGRTARHYAAGGETPAARLRRDRRCRRFRTHGRGPAVRRVHERASPPVRGH